MDVLVWKPDRHRLLIGADLPSTHAMPEGHEIPIAAAGKRHIGVLFQEPNELPRDQDVPGYAIHSLVVKPPTAILGYNPAEALGARLEARMKTVRQMLQGKPPLLSIPPTATVYDALALMARYDVGALVVLDQDRLVGMFSERDYARKVILHGKTSKELAVSEIMTPHVLCVGLDDSVEKCMTLMTDKRVRHLPVLDEDRVLGLVSIGDVVKALLHEQQFVINQLERYITA